MQGCSRHMGAFLLILGGLIFVIGGISVGIFTTRAAQQAAERAARLPAATAQDVERSAVGAEVLVEGVIDARNPTRVRNFVAYVREEYRGIDTTDNREIWREDERWTPPLLIQVADGVVRIANDTYRIEEPPVQWQESDRLEWNSFSGEGTKRYRGFEEGNTVTALGRVTDELEGRGIEAELMFGGTRDQYLAYQRTTASLTPIAGLISGGIGIAMILGGLWSLIRGG